MSKKGVLIIFAITAVTISFGIIAFHFQTNIQYNRKQVSNLEVRFSECEKHLEFDKENLLALEKQVDKLRNEFEYFTDIPENPFYEDYKNHISALIKRNISKIVKEQPVHGGHWFVTEIRFIDPTMVSVEYEDGHNSFVSKIRIIRPVEGIKFEEVK
jgi:hypothetical protein